MAKEKNSTKNEVKSNEMCVIPKELVIKRIQKLLKDYPDVFEEYFMWAGVLDSRVNIIGEGEIPEQTLEEK